jgi:hypothetical protein
MAQVHKWLNRVLRTGYETDLRGTTRHTWYDQTTLRFISHAHDLKLQALDAMKNATGPSGQSRGFSYYTASAARVSAYCAGQPLMRVVPAWWAGRTAGSKATDCLARGQTRLEGGGRGKGSSATSGAVHTRQSTTKWVRGLCAPTDYGGRCNTDVQGAWAMPAGKHAMRACVEHCAGCANCRVVSFSAKNRGCSWYQYCALDALLVDDLGDLGASWAQPFTTATNPGDVSDCQTTRVKHDTLWTLEPRRGQ